MRLFFMLFIAVFGQGFSQEPNDYPYMELLEKFIVKKKIKSVVDVGCGEWQFSEDFDWSGIEYIGYDIDEKVVENNNQNFSSANITFIQEDATLVDLPSADLLICKDILQHLSNGSILSITAQFDKFKYCLITNDFDPESGIQNRDISNGDFRPLDLTASPFNLKGKKFFDYRSGKSHKQVLLIMNRRIVFQDMFSSNPD